MADLPPYNYEGYYGYPLPGPPNQAAPGVPESYQFPYAIPGPHGVFSSFPGTPLNQHPQYLQEGAPSFPPFHSFQQPFTPPVPYPPFSHVPYPQPPPANFGVQQLPSPVPGYPLLNRMQPYHQEPELPVLPPAGSGERLFMGSAPSRAEQPQWRPNEPHASVDQTPSNLHNSNAGR
jgi:hypothetical protein